MFKSAFGFMQGHYFRCNVTW